MDRDKTDHDHFIALDVKKLKHIEAERKRLLTAVLQGASDIHFMRCPRCSRKLASENIKDISIIICDQCRGIWVDSESLAQILRLSDDMVDAFLDHITKK